jgi:hypothetical protein
MTGWYRVIGLATPVSDPQTRVPPVMRFGKCDNANKQLLRRYLVIRKAPRCAQTVNQEGVVACPCGQARLKDLPHFIASAHVTPRQTNVVSASLFLFSIQGTPDYVFTLSTITVEIRGVGWPRMQPPLPPFCSIISGILMWRPFFCFSCVSNT